MIRRISLLLTGLILMLPLAAQTMALKITYQQKVKPQITALSGWDGNYTLYANGAQYAYMPTALMMAADSVLTVEGEGSVMADLNTNEIFDLRTIEGTTYLVTDTLPDRMWEMQPGTKDVLGQRCKKATLKLDDGSIVTAWYTEDIPIPVAPRGFFGLMGLVLELETPQYTCTANAMELSTPYTKVLPSSKAKRIKPSEVGAKLIP